ncbi:lysophospholipid acyltransferase family protein [bacterium AH-315-C20]|nr:lysophospholipid acyltransferase family protein [bacterium AH-315-C20]
MVKIADRILFYLFLKPLSYFPLGILYFYSAIAGWLTYRLVRYRRGVVRRNLVNAFPDKSEAEIKKIEWGFYRHFMDFIAESIKAGSISKKNVMKRCSIKNPELLNEIKAQGKSIIVCCGHYNNWEFFALSLPELVPYETYSVYQPLSNPFFDHHLYKQRTRAGMKLIKTSEVIPFYRHSMDEQKLVVIVNDQSPRHPPKAYWNTFMSQETGWNIGPEKLAQKFDHVVLFGHSRRVKKGYYEVEFKIISNNAPETSKGEITDTYTQMLEDLIRDNPRNWLWSHKRWKHSRPV